MKVQNCHVHNYVYTGFHLGKSAMQLHGELVQVFREASWPSLRCVQCLVASIRDDSFTLRKDASLGRPRSVRSPVLVNKVNELMTKDARLLIRAGATFLNSWWSFYERQTSDFQV